MDVANRANRIVGGENKGYTHDAKILIKYTMKAPKG